MKTTSSLATFLQLSWKTATDADVSANGGLRLEVMCGSKNSAAYEARALADDPAAYEARALADDPAAYEARALADDPAAYEARALADDPAA